MKNFLVSWEIEIKAPTEQDAAIRAWEILRMPGSTANVFSVQAEGEPWPEKVDVQECIESAADESPASTK